MINVSLNRTSLRTVSCVALTSVFLAACGGGGGGSSTPSGKETALSPSSSASVIDSSVSSSTTAPFGQSAANYTLSFAEEFNNGLPSNVWNDAIWYDSSNATKNYAVENGALKIWPQRDASGNFFNRTIDTDGKFYQTYGYFEIEAKLPYGKGTWPAFWLFNHDGAAPNRPEIDILEAYAGGGPNSGWSDSNLHPTAYAATVWPTGIENGYAGTKTMQNLGDLSGGFHKYAVKWEPGKQTFYFDGKEMYSVNVGMKERMYIILDLWFGSASGTPDNTTPTGKTNSYEVNYVRAWKLK
jgi:beta-glucanase (GH16 family)